MPAVKAGISNWGRRRDLNPRPSCPYHWYVGTFGTSKHGCSIRLSYVALSCLFLGGCLLPQTARLRNLPPPLVGLLEFGREFLQARHQTG